MKNFTITFACLFLLMACGTSKKISKSSSQPSAKVSTAERPTETNTNFDSDITFKQVYDAGAQDVNGTWVMMGVDSYGTLDNLEEPSIFSSYDVQWSFVEPERGANQVYITVPKGYENAVGLTSGEHQYWKESCLITIGRQTYMYQVFSILDNQGNELGKELSLIANNDLAIPDAASTMRFRSSSCFWACGVDGSGENGSETKERPIQIANLIEGIVMQANMPYPNLDGQWELKSYQAYAPEDKLPIYEDGDVLWTFSDDGYKLTVTKSAAPIKNDYSLGAGEWQAWANECMIKIGHQTFLYELKEGKNGEAAQLTLNSGLEPSIADEEQYFIFEKLN